MQNTTGFNFQQTRAGDGMTWVRNITGLDDGIYRSVNGASDEQIFIGRATKAGFITFFKVWRDNPYDVVLDYNGHLYRIEVKGFSGNNVNVTRGSRSGQQIDRNAPDRTRLISRNDCDFVAAVNSLNGECHIIPVDIIEIIGTENLTLNLINIFKEKWRLFLGGRLQMNLEIIRNGLLSQEERAIAGFAQRLGIPPLPTGHTYNPPGTRRTFNHAEEKFYRIFRIWEELDR